MSAADVSVGTRDGSGAPIARLKDDVSITTSSERILGDKTAPVPERMLKIESSTNELNNKSTGVSVPEVITFASTDVYNMLPELLDCGQVSGTVTLADTELFGASSLIKLTRLLVRAVERLEDETGHVTLMGMENSTVAGHLRVFQFESVTLTDKILPSNLQYTPDEDFKLLLSTLNAKCLPISK